MEHLFILDTEILKHINYIYGALFFAFTGSYIQEILNIYSLKQKTTRLHKIIIGTIIGALLYLVIQNKYFHNIDVNITTIFNVFCGSIGYEVFNRCSSIENIKILANDINDILRNVFGIDKLLSDKSDKNKKDKK